jgi:hypothetical protein
MATTDIERATTEIGQAWNACQKPNLEFGKICCKWRDLFGQKKSGPQTKGTGLAQILSQLSINEGTAYYWMEKYEISIGTKVPRVAVPVSQEDLDAIKANCKPTQPHMGSPTEQSKFARSNELFSLFPKEWRFNISEHATAVKPFSISMDLTEVELKELAEIITLGARAR